MLYVLSAIGVLPSSNIGMCRVIPEIAIYLLYDGLLEDLSALIRKFKQRKEMLICMKDNYE